MNSETVLRLQPVIGNQGVQHILARSHGAASANSAGTRFIQRGRDPEFTFGGQSIERTTLRTQEELNKAVESTIDEELGGVDNLFLKNVVATSVADWRDLVFDNLDSYYTLEGLAKPQVLIAVNWVKDKHRQATLRRYAESYVYSSEDGPPYSLDNFKQRMVENGVYLERNDDAVVEALYETEGKFAQRQIQVAANNIELSDQDNIVVVLDHHQNKHQRDKIAELPVYTGAPGSKFASGKGLDWHRTTRAPAVRSSVKTAVDAGRITPKSGAYSPSKDAIGGIIYDLTITYDDDTGKYVGTYHCNPVVDEGE